MRKIVLVVVCLLLLAPSRAFAQDPQAEARKRVGTYKVVGGAALVVIGLLKVVNSSTSGHIPDGTGQENIETFRSTTGTVLGLGVAGGGGYLIWSGMKDRAASRPKPTISIGVSKEKVVFRFDKRW